MPPRPTDLEGNALAKVFRIWDTKFSGPLRPLHWTSNTGPFAPVRKGEK